MIIISTSRDKFINGIPTLLHPPVKKSVLTTNSPTPKANMTTNTTTIWSGIIKRQHETSLIIYAHLITPPNKPGACEI